MVTTYTEALIDRLQKEADAAIKFWLIYRTDAASAAAEAASACGRVLGAIDAVFKLNRRRSLCDLPAKLVRLQCVLGDLVARVAVLEPRLTPDRSELDNAEHSLAARVEEERTSVDQMPRHDSRYQGYVHRRPSR